MTIEEMLSKGYCSDGKNNTILNPKFLKQMSNELISNSHKGEWSEWYPSSEHIIYEIDHHLNKLKIAFCEKNYEKIKEFSADIANLCEKSYTYGENNGK